MTRAERYAQCKALRDEGLLLREIAERVGLSTKTVSDVLNDPDGSKVRERKRRYERSCAGCGRTINPNGIRSETTRCSRCVADHRREQSRRWVVDSMREWAGRFGAPPSALDWNLAAARTHAYCAWKADRYEATGRPWPCTTLVLSNFDSWNAGLRAAGFEPLAPRQYSLGHAGVALMRQDTAA